MNSELKKEIKKYLSEVKKGLHCDISFKKAFLSDFKNELTNYIDEHQEVTIENIINEFGSPNQIVSNFKSSDYLALKKKININLFIGIFFIILSILLIFALIYIIYNLGGTIYVSEPYK